jgi:hypothetical protein
MTDQELDRALASALDVEPRADFQARVRVRVAAEPAPSFWLATWRMAAGAAAVAVIAVAVTFWNGSDRQPVGDERQIGTVARGPVAPEEPVLSASAEPAPPVVRVAPPSRAGGRAAAPAPAVVELPAPVISPEDAGSVALLAASARQGIAADLLTPSDGQDQPLELTVLDVPLLGDERPIEMNAGDAGERQ